eukprot:COSAG02_NODE_7125_length_3170_cov_2.337024_1_plen_45_part_00
MKFLLQLNEQYTPIFSQIVKPSWDTGHEGLMSGISSTMDQVTLE